jgi:hypothetical protein
MDRKWNSRYCESHQTYKHKLFIVEKNEVCLMKNRYILTYVVVADFCKSSIYNMRDTNVLKCKFLSQIQIYILLHV